jgi:hypothetical protein
MSKEYAKIAYSIGKVIKESRRPAPEPPPQRLEELFAKLTE